MNISMEEICRRVKRDDGIEIEPSQLKRLYVWYRKPGTGYKNEIFAIDGTSDGIVLRCAVKVNPIDDAVLYRKEMFD